jgi:leader peptidase (prepilin peptidase) / N-methyltransferase
MSLAWAAAGALTGIPAGALLREPVFRLAVPSGEPDRTACPGCAAPVPSWLPARCGYCRRRLAVPWALELATAAVLALLLGRFGGQPDMAAFTFLGITGVALAAIDLAVQRLPDRLTLPAIPLLAALLAGAALAGHDGDALVRAVLGGLALGGGYLLLALLRPGQLGGGDVKLAALAGLALGWLGWPTVLAGAVLGFGLSAVVSLGLLAARRVNLHSAISFGPFLLGGALLAVLTTGGAGS